MKDFSFYGKMGISFGDLDYEVYATNNWVPAERLMEKFVAEAKQDARLVVIGGNTPLVFTAIAKGVGLAIKKDYRRGFENISKRGS